MEQVFRKSIRLIVLSAIAVHGAEFNCVAEADEPERQDVVVAVGASGRTEYRDMFQSWAGRWEAAAKSAEAGFRAVGLDDTVSDKSVLSEVIGQLTQRESGEPVWIVLIGHGTFDGRTARFNLRGPDISAAETAALLNNAKRPVALINCASCSAPFINAASGSRRVILTATKDGSQFQLARFGEAMSLAIGGADADLNQDGQVSLLEAAAFASGRTDEFYTSSGRLATEHSLLDDSGDGLGSRLSDFKGAQLDVAGDNSAVDGSLARRWHLIRSEEERRLTSDQREHRNELERRLEELKRQRDEFSEAEYLDQLELVLIPLARLYWESDFGEESAEKTVTGNGTP